MKQMIAPFGLGVVLAVLLAVPFANTQEQKGKITNLPVPRFVSLKAAEGNVRRGPSSGCSF